MHADALLLLGCCVQGLYPFGAVKTQTHRYPVKAISEDTGEAPGSWAVMTTEIQGRDGEMAPCYAITHRRGGEVSCCLSCSHLAYAIYRTHVNPSCNGVSSCNDGVCAYML